MDERKWTNEYILSQVRAGAKDGFAASTAGRESLVTMARRRFGSWKDACHAAGLKPRSEQKQTNSCCKVEGCGKTPRSRTADYCEMHYGRQRRNGDPGKLQFDTTKTDICVHCGSSLAIQRDGSRWCSGRCKARDYRQAPKEIRCPWCQEFFVPYGRSRACSEECRKERDRVRLLKAHTGISVEQLYLRDNGICGICNEHVPNNVDINHPQAPTRDHIIPISRGGTELNDNIQLAHRICNNKKHTKVYAPRISNSVSCEVETA